MLFNITYIHSMEHRAVRLLSRRYDTSYKYLKIGINVGPSSYMEIALGDHCGTNCRYLSKRGRASTSSNGIFTRCYETNIKIIL